MDAALNLFKTAGSAVISDVFDALGIVPPVFDNALRTIGDRSAFAAPAYTIQGQPEIYTGGDRAKLEAIDAMPVGVTAVWASGDAKGVCCFGDLLASAMRARGCAAAVVDGGVRDVAFLQSCGLPVVARYATPAQGIGRWRVTGTQCSVRVRGALQEWITIEPGDIIVGDADGVIAIPQSASAHMAAKVDEWTRSESSARDEIVAGMPLLAALAKYGHL